MDRTKQRRDPRPNVLLSLPASQHEVEPSAPTLNFVLFVRFCVPYPVLSFDLNAPMLREQSSVQVLKSRLSAVVLQLH